jgi:flagellar hook-associated protein 2
MAMGIDGLVSGLDTTSLIDSLIAAESGSQKLLSTKVTKTQSLVTDLQGLNSALSTLTANAAGSSTVDKLLGVTASSSASSVSVTAAATSTPGSLTFRVDRLAQAQVSVTAAMTAWTGGSTLTLVNAAGTKTEIAVGASLQDLAANINAAGTGVTATLVASGIDSGTGDPKFRLQLASASGAAGAFSLSDGTSADVTAGTAPDVLAAVGAATVSTAQDAAVTLWAGSSAAQEITSAKNTFTDLLPGVNVTVSAVEASPVTLTISRNTTSATTAAQALVTGVDNILTTIRQKSAVTATNGGTGSKTSAGTFTGDRGVRDLSSKLSDAVMDVVNGVSPSTIGITITRTGALEFDATKFAAAMATDQAGTLDAVAKISARVEAVAKEASNTTDGTITQRITGQQASITELQDQISDWDDRLATRRARLVATYAAMETALSGLQSQSAYLASQLGTTSGSST